MLAIGWVALAISMIAIGVITRIRGNVKQEGHDTWYYFLVADKIRRHRKIPKKVDHFIFEAEYDYPPLLPGLLSLFPKKSLEKYRKAFAPLVEILHMGLVGFVAHQLTSDLVISLMAVGIYSVTPILIFEFTSLNTRSLGSLFFSACVLSLLAFSTGGSPYFLIPALVFGVAILLTHKFATQALFFTLVFFSIWEMSLLYLAFLGLIIGMAVLVSRGFYLKVIKSHYLILDFWRRNIGLLGKSVLDYLKEEGKGDREREKSLLQKFRESPKKLKIFSHPALNLWAFLLVISLIFFNGEAYLTGFSEKLMVWGCIILGLFVLITYVPQLQFIGRGRRYFEYGVLPIAVVIPILLFSIDRTIFYLLFLITLGASVAVALLVQELQLKHPEMVSIDPLTDIFGYIKNSGKKNVMCIPIGLSYPTAYFTGKRVLFHDSPSAFDEGKDFFPVATKPLYEIAEKYDIGFIIFNDKIMDVEKLDLKGFEERLKRNQYHLFERATD